jgi:hypothetical protein
MSEEHGKASHTHVQYACNIGCKADADEAAPPVCRGRKTSLEASICR